MYFLCVYSLCPGDAPAAPVEAEGRPLSRRRSAASLKLPTVKVEQVDAAALAKLKLGKAEQYVFVFGQVRV